MSLHLKTHRFDFHHLQVSFNFYHFRFFLENFISFDDQTIHIDALENTNIILLPQFLLLSTFQHNSKHKLLFFYYRLRSLRSPYS